MPLRDSLKMGLPDEEILGYGNATFYKGGMQQAQGDFWNNPTEVIGNLIPHHPGLWDEVTPILRQCHHLFVSIFQRTVSFLTMQSYYTGAQPICAAEKFFQNIFQISDNLLFANENFLDIFLDFVVFRVLWCDILAFFECLNQFFSSQTTLQNYNKKHPTPDFCKACMGIGYCGKLLIK